MTKKEKIILLYYNENKKIVVISKELKVSKQYVSKIIKLDDRYFIEKEKRKNEAKQRKKIQNKECTKKYRKILKKQKIDDSLDILHRQASIELSTRKTISNRAFRNWNSSIYEYHSRTKEYRIKDNMKNKISYAIPKKIKWE